MGNKIIIDEEVLAKLRKRILDNENRIIDLILENSTTISIDESIEERAFKKYPIDSKTFDFLEVGLNESKRKLYIDGATEQSIISEIKSKEVKDKQDNCDHEWKCDKFDALGFAIESYCDKCDIIVVH